MDKAELKTALDRLKKHDHAYAFGLAKKPDDHVLTLHRKLPGKKLLADLKKADKSKVKGTFGTVSREEKCLTFTCEKELPGVKRQFMLFLKAHGFPLKVIVLDAEGNEITDEGDEALEDDVHATDADTSTESSPGRSLEDVRKDARQLKAAIAAAVKAHPDQRGRLVETAGELKSALDAKDASAADAAIASINEILAAAGAGDDGALRSALGAWGRVRQAAGVEMARLQNALRDAYAHDTKQRPAVNQALRRLDDALAGVGDSVSVTIQSVLGAAGAKPRDAARKKAAQAVAAAAKHLATDPVMKAIDANEVLPDCRIAASLRDALAGLAAELNSPI